MRVRSCTRNGPFEFKAPSYRCKLNTAPPSARKPPRSGASHDSLPLLRQMAPSHRTAQQRQCSGPVKVNSCYLRAIDETNLLFDTLARCPNIFLSFAVDFRTLSRYADRWDIIGAMHGLQDCVRVDTSPLRGMYLVSTQQSPFRLWSTYSFVS